VEDKLKELSALLREEVCLHEALKADLDREVGQDGKLNGGELLRLQGHKHTLVRRINELEQDRMAVVKALARAWNEPPEALTLRRIIPRSPDAIGEELKGSYSSLMGLVNAIRTLSKTSSGNAQSRLKAVDATLNLIHEAVKVHSTYSGSGKLQSPPVTLKHTSA
jgi:flagellar biosynthesis/type III secretory pathway chaperone